MFNVGRLHNRNMDRKWSRENVEKKRKSAPTRYMHISTDITVLLPSFPPKLDSIKEEKKEGDGQDSTGMY